MPVTIRCMSCREEQIASIGLGKRVVICSKCSGLMTEEHSPLPVDSDGTISLKGRLLAVGCDSCKTVLDIAPELIGKRMKCPRCGELSQIPLPRMKVALPNDGKQAHRNSSAEVPRSMSSPTDTTPTSRVRKANSAEQPSLPITDFIEEQKRAEGSSRRGFRRPEESAWSPDGADAPQFPSLPKGPKSTGRSSSASRHGEQFAAVDSPENSSAAPSTDAPKVSELKSVHLFRSWKTNKIKLPHFLLRGRGRLLEAILERYLATLHREQLPGVEVALAGELQNVPKVNRPLRVMHKLSEGHMGVTDILFRAEGNDLYVKFHSNPRTRITALQIGIYALLFVILYSLFIIVYLYGTGAYSSWAADYAQKHVRSRFDGQDVAPYFQKTIAEGYYSFDNNRFVAKMSDEKGIRQLQEAAANIQKLSGVSGMLNAMTKGNRVETPNALTVGLALDLINVCQYDSFAANAAMAAHQGASSTELFFWTEPSRNYVVMFNDVPAYSSIEVLNGYKDGLRKNFVLNEGVFGKELANRVIKTFDSALTYHRPWSPPKLFLSDPKLAMLSVGGPSAFFALLIGAALYFLPVSILNFPCRCLGWPTPDEFQNLVQARNAWSERVLSDTLLNDFGVQEGDRFAIMSQ